MPGPLVITGTGGSGTRVVARIAMKAGWHLGQKRNPQEDNLRIAKVENDPIGTRFLENGGPTEDQLTHYLKVVERERFGQDQWGWKHAQTMYFVPWLHEEYPDTLRILHVIRDGRDMAYARNVFEHWFGPLYMSEMERAIAPRPVRNAKLWWRSNVRLTEFAEAKFPGRYHQVRLEDLCENTEAVVTGLFDSLRATEGTGPAVGLVETPDTFGRWKDKPEDERNAVEQAAMPGLERYGYA